LLFPVADMGRLLGVSPLRLDGGVNFLDILETVCSSASSVQLVSGGALDGGALLAWFEEGSVALDGALEGGGAGVFSDPRLAAVIFLVGALGAEDLGFEVESEAFDLAVALLFLGPLGCLLAWSMTDFPGDNDAAWLSRLVRCSGKGSSRLGGSI